MCGVYRQKSAASLKGEVPPLDGAQLQPPAPPRFLVHRERRRLTVIRLLASFPSTLAQNAAGSPPPPPPGANQSGDSSLKEKHEMILVPFVALQLCRCSWISPPRPTLR